MGTFTALSVAEHRGEDGRTGGEDRLVGGKLPSVGGHEEDVAEVSGTGGQQTGEVL